MIYIYKNTLFSCAKEKSQARANEPFIIENCSYTNMRDTVNYIRRTEINISGRNHIVYIVGILLYTEIRLSDRVKIA